MARTIITHRPHDAGATNLRDLELARARLRLSYPEEPVLAEWIRIDRSFLAQLLGTCMLLAMLGAISLSDIVTMAQTRPAPSEAAAR